MRFKERLPPLQHESAGWSNSTSVGAAAARRYDGDNNTGGYTRQHIFNVDKKAFFEEKKNAIHDFHGYREKKSMPDFKASKDKEANAVGYFKLKPLLIYHSEIPRALKNVTKFALPVPCKWNNKA